MGTLTKNKKPKTITLLLRQWQNGNTEAFNQIVDRVYAELKGIAGKILSDRRNPELGATILVNEAYQALVNRNEIEWSDRRHFFNFAAKVMRCQVLESARRQSAVKRGGDQVKVVLEDHMGSHPSDDPDITIFLDQLLTRLEGENEDAVRIFELRYFVGCTVPETAEISGLSQATIKRKYDLVKAWLYARLKDKL